MKKVRIHGSRYREKLKQARLVVVKLGTGVLSDAKGSLDPKRIRDLARQLESLRRKGRKVVLVSSGAVGAGMTRLGLRKRPTHINDLQTCAAIGQNLLMACYDREFSKRNITVAQILLTHEDFRNEERRRNAKNTISNLLRRNVVPIINENDAVSYAEIKFGDNDQLASFVHTLVGADACFILSTVDGFYVSEKGNQRILNTIEKITHSIECHAGGAGSQRSVGGMQSKILAARRVLATRKPLLIANGRVPNVLIRLLAGEEIGTIFLP
jgi:glutamate 5-kinase